ncbi:uncharacterized protein LOC142229617 isoform X2 [Haematobia irritans]|uniref:uncharacterized protein LOC142229617 isoform X2 n=1 Tax=Haematobia irritans TaxID=7368 RepID=UPI003F503BE7
MKSNHQNKSCITVMASNEFPKKREYAIVTALNLIKNIWDKLKISLVLPKIFENPKLLHKYLKGTTYEEDCLKMIMDFRHKMEREPLSSSLRLNYDLVGIIDYFHANQEILEVLPDWFGDIDSDEKTIMNSFQRLLELAEDRFNRLGLKHLIEEKHLHDIYLANEQIKEDLNDLSRQIQHRKIHDQWKFAIHTGLIISLENRLADFQLENETRIKDGISQSYREIRRLNVKYDTIQKELEDHLKIVQNNYDQEVLKNLKKEKKLRDENSCTQTM